MADKHKCPPYCHKCPEMPGGDVLPMCMGAAVYPEMWRERCTCYREREEILKRIAKLEAEAAELRVELANHPV